MIIARSFVVIVYFEEAPLTWTVVVLPRLRLSNSHCAPSLALFKILMTRSTTGSDAEGAPAATARALAPEDHGESSSGSSSKPPVIMVPYSIGDYHLLEQSVEGFSVPIRSLADLVDLRGYF